MRLPTDILLSILDALSRESLDTVAISTRRLGVLCTTNYHAYPLREINLTVDCRSDAASLVSNEDETDHTDAKYLHTNLESLGRYLAHATLIYLSLLGSLDERILELLLPFKDRFRTTALKHNSSEDSPEGLSFASPNAFTRAYSELFFCRSLQISPVWISGSPPDVNGANARLLTLPCVQQCSFIGFKNMPFANAGDITAWLISGSDKVMMMQGTPHHEREAFAHELIDKIVEQFRSASSASNFFVCCKIGYGAPGIEATAHENTATSEKLVVTLERRSFYCLTIRRSTL